MPVEELPPDFIKLIRRLRATAAGQHALRVYRECRFPPDGPQRLVPVNDKRDTPLIVGLVIIAGMLLAMLCRLLI